MGKKTGKKEREKERKKEKKMKKSTKIFKQHKTFKQKWNEVDEVCPTCNQVTKVNRGLTKQNLKKMFRKPTLQDWIIFIMLILTLFMAWTYQNEVQQYKEIIRNPQELCQVYYESIIMGNFDNLNASNVPFRLIENEKEEIK